MKLQLFVEPVNNQIIGYNKLTETIVSKDSIIIDIDEGEPYITLLGKYYIDGKIADTNSNIDTVFENIPQLESKCNQLQKIVDNEYKTFMDNLLDGKSMDEAKKIAQANREKLNAAKENLAKVSKHYQSKLAEKVKDKFQKEYAKNNCKYDVSILLLIRDENEYLEEWLSHHIKKLQIDHIYIYDNESKVPVRTFLKNLNNKLYTDHVTIIDWATTKNTQEDANNHFLKNYAQETKWFIPIDTDEFIQLNADKSLKEMLANFEEQYGAVICQWETYGANGQEKKSDAPVLERFTKAAENYDVNTSGKYFIQSVMCDDFIRHEPRLRLYCDIEPDGNTMKQYFQLNHYFTKSYEEWCTKMSRGSCDPKVRRGYQLFFKVNPDMEYLNTGENYLQSYGA